MYRVKTQIAMFFPAGILNYISTALHVVTNSMS